MQNIVLYDIILNYHFEVMGYLIRHRKEIPQNTNKVHDYMGAYLLHVENRHNL